MSITVPAAATVPTVPSGSQLRATRGAQRHPSYISASSAAAEFTVDEPDIAQTDLQHRLVKFTMQPGANTFVIDAPEGTVTLSGSIYDSQHFELSYAAPVTVSVTTGASTRLELTFRPVIWQAWVGVFGTSVFDFYPVPPFPPYAVCDGVAGQFVLSGTDFDGNIVDGAGNFLDSAHSDVTVSITGGFTDNFSVSSFSPGGVDASASTSSSVTGGSYRQSKINLGAQIPALKASANSSNVLGLVVGLWDESTGPQCFPVSGG